MDNGRFNIFFVILLLVSVLISSIAQVLLKKAAEKHYDSFIHEYLNPLVIFAYFIFFLSTLISVYAYKGIPLSMGPILEASSYFYITVFGIKIFGEHMNKKKIIALILIISGILIYALMG